MTSNPFKGQGNQYYTKALFYETDETGAPVAMYTLKDEDHRVGTRLFKSLRRLFLETKDPTGYTLSQEYLGGWPHLKKLLQTGWFRDYWTLWQEEMEAMLQASALAEVYRKASDKTSKENFQANKYLLEQGWKPKDKKGRPSKARIKEEAQRIAEAKSSFDEDYDRIISTIQ